MGTPERLLILQGLANQYQDFLSPSDREELEELTQKNYLKSVKEQTQAELADCPEDDFKIWKALQF